MTPQIRDLTAHDVALWDIEDEQRVQRAANLHLGPVTTADVEEFCSRHHYTRRAGSAVWRYGLWHDVTLYGVVAYNLPTRETCASVFGDEHVANVWHMGRLVLSERAPINSESRLIGGSLREIKRTHPEVWAILTYAATDAGHIGYVYQATNAIYTGTGGDATYYVDERGQRRGTYINGRGVGRAAARDLGWTVHDGGVKHRYVYVLGSRTERRHRLRMLRLPVLPYPKEGLTSDVDGQTVVAGEPPPGD